MKPASGSNRRLKLVLKLLVTGICAWYIAGKIDWSMTTHWLQQINGWYLLPGGILFVLSKWVSAIRLNIYFRNIELKVSAGNNLRLYWLGMFYNLFLPGAISGDIYKVILLTRKYNKPYKKNRYGSYTGPVQRIVGFGNVTGYTCLVHSITFCNKLANTFACVTDDPGLLFYPAKTFPGFYTRLL